MKAKVIAVHGTYVADPCDYGEQWWQKSGALDRFLSREMSDEVDELIVFHWSGDNSAMARNKAGSELFRLLQQLEREGAPYHIVAHSHGGGVVLEALMDAVSLGASGPRGRGASAEALRGLISWSTVGTPFLSASPEPHWSNRLRNPYRMLLSLFLAILNLALALRLLAFAFIPLSPLLTVVLLLVLLWTTALSGRLSANGFLLTRMDACVEAMRRFGDRWLPLWSTGDEVFTGLTVTAPPPQWKLVKPIHPAINPYTPLRSIVRWPFAFTIAQAVNLFRPRLNRTLESTVRRALQGYDHPFGEVVSIAAGPLPPFHAYPSLPARIDEELIQSANTIAQQSVAVLRSVLYAAAISGDDMRGLAASLQKHLSGGGLVHTRYFDHDGVLRILELHMRGTHAHADEELPAWFRAMRESVDAAIAGAGVQSSSWMSRASSSGSSSSSSSSPSGSTSFRG